MNDASQEQPLPIREKAQPQVYALINYGDSYVQPLLLSALSSLLPPQSYTLISPPSTWPSTPEISLPTLLPSPDSKILQIMPYESIDFDFASSHPSTSLVNSYVIRKALIRKHFLSATVDGWVAKHPASALKTHVKRSEAFEVDYAEFLDDALVEAFDLRESLERNEEVLEGGDGDGDGKAVQWWILKPSMSDRGQGIRLFSTMEQLQEIFDGWEVESDEEEEEDDDDEAPNDDDDASDKPAIMTSHLRHFVAQPYIHPPLLLPEFANRKFHLRVYVLCLGSMRVFVYDEMLALFAAEPYTAPSYDTAHLDAHLTNTCLQTAAGGGDGKDGDLEHGAVHLFDELPLAEGVRGDIKAQIREVTGDLFEAAARGMTVHFQPLPNAFEAYGLDFLVDAAGTAWLLEVNAFPDFRQSGHGPAGGVVKGFWRGVVNRGVRPFVLGGEDKAEEGDGMVLVREVDLGRRWG